MLCGAVKGQVLDRVLLNLNVSYNDYLKERDVRSLVLQATCSYDCQRFNPASGHEWTIVGLRNLVGCPRPVHWGQGFWLVGFGSSRMLTLMFSRSYAMPPLSFMTVDLRRSRATIKLESRLTRNQLSPELLCALQTYFEHSLPSAY